MTIPSILERRRSSKLPPPPAGRGPQWRTEGAVGPPPKASPPRTTRWWVLLVILGIGLVINWVIVRVVTAPADRTPVAYSAFRAEVIADNVAAITAKGDAIDGTFRRAIHYPDASSGLVTDFSTRRPAFADDDVLATLFTNGAVVEAKAESTGASVGWTLLYTFGPIVLLAGAYVWFMRRTMRGLGGGIGGIGRSKAVRFDRAAARTTFADVAGIDEAKDELMEIVDFLKSPARYRELGARTPRGVLLMGPPGTGKTLLARAIAGEADVPFFSMSASEFIEMIVGVGASRVRDLFDQAKAVAPSIVFIDELDAIGRARGSSASFGGVDEREQTLNQILTEMDGFTGNEGVIVLAATNRPDVLDPALLRPGRFDRRVVVNPPDQAGRAAILEVHTRSVPLAGDVTPAAIAALTPGMVGADLANLVNEAALHATRQRRTAVAMDDFTAALERIVLGAELKIIVTADDRRRTAYHEAGHALLGMLEPEADPVRKVSIIPRGRSLGVTLQSPDEDRYGATEGQLQTRIRCALGGRVAERLVFDSVTTGAESDLQQVTSIARQMVARWGMSDAVGPLSLLPPAGSEPTFSLADPTAPSEATRRLVDSEVRRIVDDADWAATELLTANRDRLDWLAAALLEHETLDAPDAYAAADLAEPEPQPAPR
jgi:cell division protease FtsH